MAPLIQAMQAPPKVQIVDPARKAKATAASTRYRECLERNAEKIDDHVSPPDQIGALVAPHCFQEATSAEEAILDVDPTPPTMRERVRSIFKGQRLWNATRTVVRLRGQSK